MTYRLFLPFAIALHNSCITLLNNSVMGCLHDEANMTQT